MSENHANIPGTAERDVNLDLASDHLGPFGG